MALLTSTSEMVTYDNVYKNMAFEKLLPYIETAERTYLIDVLSKEQYTELEAAYQNSIKETSPTPLDQEDIDLLHECRRALVQLTLYCGAASLFINLDNTGLHRIESNDEKSAFQYQEINWKNSKLRLGMQCLDDLEEFLEDHIDNYPTYAASDTYTKRFDFFIRSADEFNQCLALPINRFTYLRLLGLMRICERGQLKRTIGTTIYDEIKSQLASDSLTETNEDLLYTIRCAVANHTLSKALTQLSIKVDDRGITVFSNDNSKTQEVQKAADLERINALRQELFLDAAAFFNELEEATYIPADDEDEFTTRANIDPAIGGGRSQL